MIRGRPKKKRLVKNVPKIDHFSPRGRPGRPDEACLGLDEFEAVRLVDFEGLGQKAAAESMQISQQTLSRILRKARKTLADMLVTGKRINIEKAIERKRKAI
jgi:uncharacterized protein